MNGKEMNKREKKVKGKKWNGCNSDCELEISEWMARVLQLCP